MGTRSYDRTITLYCPTCAGTQFEYGDDIDAGYATVRCIGCDRVMTKDELMLENLENIDAHVSEIGNEVTEDFAKEMKATLTRAFRSNKYIKIR